MNLEDRAAAFIKLGKLLSAIDADEKDRLVTSIRSENSWFTQESVCAAIDGIVVLLEEAKLKSWVSSCELGEPSRQKVVAVVMAGNIPFVGFHDFLCVLVSGHRIQIKPSSKDTILMNFIVKKLIEVEPRYSDDITIVEQLKNFDAVIATGSDNSARYFEFYFKKYPHIIRKNRTSVAVLTGFESSDELELLGRDVFSYFGLGCRNVSKLFVPKEFDFSLLLQSWKKYESLMMHHKYHNNYDYQKSILLVNKIHHLDSGFVLLQESSNLVSPISVVYFEYYESWDSVTEKLAGVKNKIQCIVGNARPATVRIGDAQCPIVDDYADNIDTMKFLASLS